MSKEFKVYVAASTAPEEAARVRAVVAGLRSVGVKVTSGWLDRVTAAGEANSRTASQVDRRVTSLTCLEEINASDAVLVLMPHNVASFGSGWEASHAHDAGKHLAFAGDTAASVFASMGIEFERDGAAIAHFGEMAEAYASDFDFDVSDVTQPMRAVKA